MQPVASIRPSLTWLRRNLRDGATCTTRRRASVSLMVRLENPSQTCFHAKQVARSQRQTRETVPVVLRSNHWQTVDFGFDAQPRNSCSSSSRARCRPHTVSPDLSISQPPSIRPVRSSPVLYTRSPTHATIIDVARHATPASCTLRDKQTWFSKRTKDKGKITEPSRIRIQTLPSQWLIIIKLRNWQLSFSYVDIKLIMWTHVRNIMLNRPTSRRC
jgi:hypothetical protein